MKKITALQIKLALLWYFRFKRQWLCASECMQNDVMAINASDLIEVEIKINKYDLWKGEAKKDKHKIMANPSGFWRSLMPDKFYICIPLSLEEEARKWVEQTNKKYGIIRYNPEWSYWRAISIARSATRLKTDSSLGMNTSHKIMMRVCAENVGLLEKLVKDKINENI